MTEAPLSAASELEVQEKQEVTPDKEQTVQGRYYVPYTDIYESPDALVVIMEIPGVDKADLSVSLDKDQLAVEGHISLDPYSNLKPLLTEYSVGHFARTFRLSSEINKDGITASVDDGVLTLTLPKSADAATRTIAVQ